jgi:hypothetical protein
MRRSLPPISETVDELKQRLRQERNAQGGLAALLDISIAKGKALSLAPAVLASIEQALHEPAGFASYQALRQWVHQKHGLDGTYQPRSSIVRSRFKTNLNVPRPSPTKNP